MSELVAWVLLAIVTMILLMSMIGKRLGTMSPKFHWEADVSENANWALYFGSLYVGEIHQFKERPKGEMSWSAWVRTSVDGNEIGWFATEAEARTALMKEVNRAISE